MGLHMATCLYGVELWDTKVSALSFIIVFVILGIYVESNVVFNRSLILNNLTFDKFHYDF